MSATGNNVRNNAKQRVRRKQPGGITGRGFRPGKSGNPKGRPRSRGLINALKIAIAEVRKDGRTVEQLLVEALVQEALTGKNRLSAIQAIFDRVEGKPKQQVDLNDTTAAFSNRSDEELLFYAQHGWWPEDDTAPSEQHGEK